VEYKDYYELMGVKRDATQDVSKHDDAEARDLHIKSAVPLKVFKDNPQPEGN
jgi:hypothetical protein